MCESSLPGRKPAALEIPKGAAGSELGGKGGGGTGELAGGVQLAERLDS